MRIAFTEKFKRAFDRLPANIQKKAWRHIGLLAADLRHPGIKAKKITSSEDVWEGRVDQSYRFTFQIEGDTLVFRRVGTHDILKSP